MRELTMKEYDEEIVNIISDYNLLEMKKAIADFNDTVKIVPFNKDKEKEMSNDKDFAG